MIDDKLGIIKECMQDNRILSKDEMTVLVIKAQNGDEEARNTLICSNMGMVVKMAYKYEDGDRISIDDLVMEGSLGLMKAISLYDTSKDASFSTFAHYWIRTMMITYIRDKCNLIRVPQNVQWEKSKASKYIDKKTKAGCSVTAKEVTERYSLTECEAQLLLDKRTKVISYDASISSNIDKSIIETLASDMNIQDEVTQKFLNDDVLMAFSKLEPRERLVLTKRFGLDGKETVTLSEIGKSIGKSTATIQNIEKKGINNLREILSC